jgi:WD40 repeat protein
MNLNYKVLVVLILLVVTNFQAAYTQQYNHCQATDVPNNISVALPTVEGGELLDSLGSPSCRYELGVYSIPELDELHRRIVIWDSYTQQIIINYIRPRENNRITMRWFWSPDEREFVIGGYFKSVYPGFSNPRGVYQLWNLTNGTTINLQCPPEIDRIVPSFETFFWDNERNWLWVGSWEGVLAYDRLTGEVVRSFPNPPWGGSIGYYAGHNYRFSLDGTHVVVIFDAGSGLNDALTVWDINDGMSFPVNVEGFVTHRMASPAVSMSECASSIALSPDNRYLALGYTVIRIWDLENLQPAYEDRLPLYRHDGPEANIRCLRFVDANTIETNSVLAIQRWDLHTGAPIP